MCKILAGTKNMAREEWIKMRKQGIGGSDAGAVCGLNPYTSALDVYYEKTHSVTETEKQDNEAMRMGRDLEDYVAKRFCEETGFKVRRSNRMYCHEEYPFMIADVDRLITGREQGLLGLECKTASPYTAEKWKDGQVPAHYLIQCHHYMAVLGAEAWYLAVIIYGREFKWVRIERDEEIIRHLIQIETRFWKDYVLQGILPEPDGSDAAGDFINRYFEESRQNVTVPLIGFDEKLERRAEITKQMDVLAAEKQKIEQEVKMFMQDAEFAEDANFQVSWKKSVSNRLDTARLKAERPEIYKEYCSQTASRRFLVKAS